MFGRPTAVRIREQVKAAQDALAKGRLEEAFEIASAPALAGERSAGPILERLAVLFLERGQDHLLSKRFPSALADFDRAARCGHQQTKVQEWQRRAREALQDDAQAERAREAALAAARQRLAAGSLAGAAGALAHAPEDDPQAGVLAQQIQQQADRAKQALAASKAALKAGDPAGALRRFRDARRLDAKLDGLADMESRLVTGMVKQATEHYKSGRLDQAERDLALLGDVGAHRNERLELQEALRLGRKAARALREDHYTRAGVLIGRLAQMGPKAGWVSDVRGQLIAVEKHRRNLLEGPLGMISSRDAPIAPRETPPDPADTVAAPPRRVERRARPPLPDEVDRDKHGLLPKRLLLRIDGVGSFLLLRGERIGIGRAGSGASADLQLVSDLSDRQAEIVRAGDDYFLMASSGVKLAGRPVDYTLLQDGDRIRLSKRVRLKFVRPSLKSNSAALDLGDGVRTTTDCRRVILWSGPLLMGGTRECHVRFRPGLGGFILLERGGQLLMKPMGPGGEATPIALGRQTEVGDLRLSIHAWEHASGPGRVIG